MDIESKLPLLVKVCSASDVATAGACTGLRFVIFLDEFSGMDVDTASVGLARSGS
jgi:hypothetical protein